MNTDVIKKAVADAAAELGIDKYEIRINVRESAGAEALKDEITSVSYELSQTMTVRCVVDGKSGYAGVAMTSYADGTEEPTLPIALDDYSMYFYAN